MELPIKILDDRAIVPRYAHAGDAALDVYPCEFFTLNPKQIALVKLGFSLDIPDGYEVQIRPRSGLALKHGVTVLNAPATIDSGYTGEIGVILINHGDNWYQGTVSRAIAQLVLAPVSKAEIVLTDSIVKVSQRGEQGYGSTDTKTQA